MAKKQQDETVAADPSALLTVSELGATYEAQFEAVSEDGAFTRHHLGADTAHGWTRHKHWKGEEVRLSAADYLAAIAAFKKDGGTHGPANLRPLTVHTEDEMKAKLAADKAAPKPLVTKKQHWTPAHARAATMARANELAQAAKKARG